MSTSIHLVGNPGAAPESRPHRFLRSLTLAFGLLACALTSLRADDLSETSLGLVPADAAFYTALFNNETQYEAFVNSNAYRRLKQMPFVQLGLFQARTLWNDPANDELAQFKEMLENPENQELVELIKSAFSQEVFFFGDLEYARQLAMLQDFSSAMREVQLESLSDGTDPEQKLAEKVLEVLDKYQDDIRIPDTVVGFKVTDVEAANRQIDRLEQVAAEALEGTPQLRERLRRETIGDAEFLTWDLDGSLLPWDELEDEDLEGITPAQRDKMIEVIKSQKLRLAMGVRDGYLLLSVGDTNDHLEKLGEGDTLVGHPRLEPLRKHSDKTLTSVSYVSEDFLREAGNIEGQLDDLVRFAEAGVSESALDESVKEELVEDVKALMARLKEEIPSPDTVLQFTFLADTGYEGYQYNYGENPQLDFSKPLTILEHVGGKPILFGAGRTPYSPEDYELLSRIIGRSVYYAEQFVLAEMDEEDRAMFEKVKADVFPLIKRLDEVSREKFFPALKDGQGAIIVDASLSTGQIHQAAPTPRNALPLPELAIVAGVSDKEALKEALESYLEIAQEIVDVAQKYDENDEIPNIEIPTPEQRPGVRGTIYYYPIPPHIGLDEQLAPAMGLSKDFLTLALSPKTAERLLTPEPLAVGGVLEDAEQNLGSAAYFDFAGLLNMLEPWINYGIDVARAQTLGGDADQADPTTEIVKGQLAQVWEIMRCFQGGASATYEEDGVIVTHFTWNFQDLE